MKNSFANRAASVVAAGNYGGYDSVQDWIKFQYTPRKKFLEETIAAYKRLVDSGAAKPADRGYLKGDSSELTALENQYKLYTKNGTRLTT